MNSLGIFENMLSVMYRTSNSIVNVLQDPTDGKLISVVIDDGEDIQEYNFGESRFVENPSFDSLQWGNYA